MMDFTNSYLQNLGIRLEVIAFLENCEQKAAERFAYHEQTAFANQVKIAAAFQKNQVSSRHFYPSTGYGYGDDGRDKLCAVFADAFGAESAIVSPAFMSGTHAIHTALSGLLRPGDTVLSISGAPYDTLRQAIDGMPGSLQEYGISFDCVPLQGHQIDMGQVLNHLQKRTPNLIYIQRSTGYDIRPAFTTEYIGNVIQKIRQYAPDTPIFADNCYGEFVCADEPTDVGADVIAGSLIKNPGGGIAPTGGYIVGRADLIEKIAGRYSVPGIGIEIGSYAFGYQPFFQGLFMAPHVVLQAVKGVILAAVAFTELGYETLPAYADERGDITQTILFGVPEPLEAFVRSIQKASPVDGHVVPYAWDMPGYEDPVIMAAGTFVQGASIELTADAPIREPYCAYLQGGLTYEHAKMGILFALNEIMKP